MWKVLLGWSAAVVTATLTGSVVQSQLNLAAIGALSQRISLGDRLGTTVFDLVNFAPLWGAVVGFGFLLGWPIAGLLVRRWPDGRRVLFPLAGFVAVVTALQVMNAALPVTVVAAARSLSGLLLLALCGALGGWIYLQVVGSPGQRQNGRI